MATTILSLPVELIELIADEEPSIILAFRAANRSLRHKLHHKFLKHFFEEISVAATSSGIAKLAWISENEKIASTIIKLRFTVPAGVQRSDLNASACAVFPGLNDEFVFRTLLCKFLQAASKCTLLHLWWNGPEPSLDSTQQSFDMSSIYFDVAYAIIVSNVPVHHLSIWPFDAKFSLNDWVRAASVSPCWAIALTRVSKLHIRIDDDTGLAALSIPTSTTEGSRPCLYATGQDLSTLTKGGFAVQRLLSHFPDLKELFLLVGTAPTNWLPLTFGANLEQLEIQDWHYEGWSVCKDGGQKLVEVLRRCPKLRSFDLRSARCPTLHVAKAFFANLATLETLKLLKISEMEVDEEAKALCLTEDCMLGNAANVLLKHWETTAPARDIPRWIENVHGHSYPAYPDLDA